MPNELVESRVQRAAAEIPWGYKITDVPGWAYSGSLRMYYYIPEEKYVPADAMQIDIPKLKVEVEESAIHPHLLVSLNVAALMVIFAVICVLNAIYKFLSVGWGFAVFMGLFFLVMCQVMLLLSRPMPYEIENYKRRKK